MRTDEDIPANARWALGAILALVATCAGAGCSETKKTPATPPPATENPIDETRLRGYFATMDQDGNGFISRPEFEGERGAVFLAIDKNNSLSLTADEMHLTPEAFATLAGGDGIVTPAEFNNGAVASFEQIDADHDLQLDYDELRDFVLQFGS